MDFKMSEDESLYLFYRGVLINTIKDTHLFPKGDEEDLSRQLADSYIEKGFLDNMPVKVQQDALVAQYYKAKLNEK